MKKTLLSLWMTATAFSEQPLLQEAIAAKKASGNRSPEIKALWEKGIQAVRDSGIMKSIPVTGQKLRSG